MAPPLLDALQARLGGAILLRAELTGGGMSRVFLGHEVALKRDVVVKVLPPDLVSALSLARFRREIEVTARLQHPHILPVIAAGGDESLSYYITPYIRGESLRARMANGPITPAAAARIVREVLGAVGFAHHHGVVHRDIKPGNVLLSEGHAILADFGIARALSDPDSPHPGPSASSVAGAQAYLAPERPKDQAADLYAVGILLREMLTTTPDDPDVRLLAALVATATAADPAARFRTAEAFLAALDRATRPRGPRRPLVAGAFVLGIALAGVVGWQAAHRPPAPVPAIARTDTFPPVATSIADTAATPPVTPRRSLYDSAALLRRRGRPDAALPLLRALTDSAPDDAAAWLMLAAALTWSTHPSEAGEARTASVRAVALRDRLDRRGRLLAEGYLAQNEGRYPDACVAFDSARALRADFDALYGAAECRMQDDRVETGPEGPRFRGDAAAAARYYEDAWRVGEGITPSVLLQRLALALPPQVGQMRRGTTAAGEVYFGMALAVGDSLRWDVQPAGPRRMTPEVVQGAQRATTLTRARVRPIYFGWVARRPNDPEAHRRLSELLELDGSITAAGEEGVSALSEIRKAVALESAPEGRLNSVRNEIRILLRAREWREAARLSDSLLRAFPDPEGPDAEFLIGPAAVTGRIARAVALARRQGGMPQRQVRGPDGSELAIPTAISNERIAFGIRAAAGLCDAELRTAPAHLIAALDVASPPATRPRGLEASYLERTLMLALDCLDPSWTALLPEPRLPPTQVARAFVNGDTVRARGLLAALDAARLRGSPALPTMDQSVAEALARLLVADSAGARRVLQEGLDALPLANPLFFQNEHPAAALPRGMLLLAELQAAAGDAASAREWAEAASELWQRADPELGPALSRARALAAR